MNKCSVKNRISIFIILIALLFSFGTVMMAKKGQRKTQLPLLFALPQTNIGKVMPPDPDEWCRRVDLQKFDYEMEKAEEFFNTDYGVELVDWHYLRRALSYTGVIWNGPEDEEWLKFVKGIFEGCKR